MKAFKQCYVCEGECEHNILIGFRCDLHYESFTYDYREIKDPVSAKLEAMHSNYADSQVETLGGRMERHKTKAREG